MMNSLAGVAAALMTLFGASTTATHLPQNHVEPMREHASSTIAASANISCVAAAVAAREQSLDTAVATYTQGITAAYSARATALAGAYALSGNDAIRKAVKSAWATFGADGKVARKAWTAAQQSAWSQFRTAVKACGGSATAVSDSGNASLDVGLGSSQ